jgi:hypothetical protein
VVKTSIASTRAYRQNIRAAGERGKAFTSFINELSKKRTDGILLYETTQTKISTKPY